MTHVMVVAPIGAVGYDDVEGQVGSERLKRAVLSVWSFWMVVGG
jgi:hypothetical protein